MDDFLTAFEQNSQKTTIIYFILSCQKYINLRKDYVEISSKYAETLGRNVIAIQELNREYLKVKELNDSFRDKNIYIYKLKVSSKLENEEIKIKFDFFKEKLITKNKFKINKDSHYRFLYSLSFEASEFFNFKLFRDAKVNEFIENKYRLKKAQQFLIFIEYIKQYENEDAIECLLKDTANEIIKSKDKIDYEYILLYFINLLQFQNKYSELKENNKKLFELTISDFINIQKISIQKYSNVEYKKIIEIIENYRENIYEPNKRLNLDLIILLYYQIHDRKKFKDFFKEILNKIEVFKYMLKHPLIFTKYDCSELELIYKNISSNFSELIQLSKNFNEYIKFFCLHFNDNNSLIKTIDLKNIPNPDENYEVEFLKKFVDYSINSDLYFPYEKFKELVEKLNKKNFEKLTQLKSIFIKYESNYKSKEIINKLNSAIHETGKFFIESGKFNNLQIISFIQEDAKIYYDDYAKKREYASLIGYINLNEINIDFIKQFKLGGYDYKKLMKDNYQTFVHSIINKANSFKNLRALFAIFHVNISGIINKEIIWELISIKIRLLFKYFNKWTKAKFQ